MDSPINVDLTCDLRVIGWSKPSIRVSTDEGDGCDFFVYNKHGEGPELKSCYYEEWANQLEQIAQVLRAKGYRGT